MQTIHTTQSAASAVALIPAASPAATSSAQNATSAILPVLDSAILVGAAVAALCALTLLVGGAAALIRAHIGHARARREAWQRVGLEPSRAGAQSARVSWVKPQAPSTVCLPL